MTFFIPAAAIAASAHHQVPDLRTAASLINGVNLRFGYFIGFKGEGTPPNSQVRLEGPSIGVDIPLLKAPLNITTVSLSGTVIMGGQLRMGGDDDGTLYRILVTTRTPLPLTGRYGIFGTGISFGTPEVTTQFSRKPVWTNQFGFGRKLGFGAAAGLNTFIELSYFSGTGPHSGLAAEVGIRF